MIKLITFPGSDESSNVFVQAIGARSGSMTKTASGELHPKVSEFISSIKPQSDKLYVLVNALGAGEYYGSNVNGDFFEESELSKESSDRGYRSFLNAGVYRHHKNKDPSKSMGKVKLAVFNPQMRRVELVIEIDRNRAKDLGHNDLVDKLDSGGHPAVSMGCKVKHDVCSICEHKSKTRADYCDHARHMMGKIYPDGRKVFVLNPNPRFFDISFVVVGADKTSYAMHKMASAAIKLSADAAYETGLQDPDARKVTSGGRSKLGELLKRIPAAAEKIEPIAAKEPIIRKRIVIRMSGVPLGDALTTLSSMGIMLKPREYQHMVLRKLGQTKLANAMWDNNEVFTPTEKVDRSVEFGKLGQFNVGLRDLLMEVIPERSLFDPVMGDRFHKLASRGTHKSPKLVNNELLEKIAASYNGYRVQAVEKLATIVNDITIKDKKIMNRITSGLLEDGFLFGTTKTAGAGDASVLLGFLPLAYLYGAYVKKQRSIGAQLGPVDSFIEKHPNFSASMALGLTRLGLMLKQSGHLEQGMFKLLGRI